MSMFEKYKQEAASKGITLRSAESLRWFRQTLGKIQTNPRELMRDDNVKRRGNPQPGEMLMYFYDPKFRETLPYYDAFPLILLVDAAPGGFTGLNLHYLAPALRATLFDKLLDVTSTKRINETSKVAVTYDLLKSTSSVKAFKPCFKRYLTSQVQGSIYRVKPTDWELALFMPVEQFRKASRSKVWGESRKSI